MEVAQTEQKLAKGIQSYEHYKDSGVEWLGEIPEHWDIRRIKYLFNEINERSNEGSEDLLSVSQYSGVTNKSNRISDGGMLTNASTLEGYKMVKRGDLVINIMLAWNGSLGFSPFDGITSPAYSIYRIYNGNSNRYFHYLLRTDLYKSEFKRNSTGVIESRLRLYTEDFFNILSIIPPLQEQTAIAQFLDDKTQKIDAAVALKEQQIKLLQERKQILIHKAVTRGLDDSVVFKDSGVEWIGEIPEHWVVRQIKAVANTVSGGTPSSGNRQKYYNGTYPWVRTTDLNNGVLNDVPEYITEAALRDTACKIIPKKTICLAMYGGSGTIGKFSLVNLDNATLNQAVCGIISNDNVHYFFLYYSLQMMRSHWMFYADGSRKDPNISQDVIRNMPIVYPSFSEQKEISKYIETASQKIETAIHLKQQEIEKLKEYKSSLINSLVTGKMKIL